MSKRYKRNYLIIFSSVNFLIFLGLVLYSAISKNYDTYKIGFMIVALVHGVLLFSRLASMNKSIYKEQIGPEAYKQTDEYIEKKWKNILNIITLVIFIVMIFIVGIFLK